jgi:signal transduction histidine kinase
MDIFTNLDLLSVGVVIAVTGLLGFVVFYNNSRSITHRSFLLFCLMTIGWGTTNFLSYKVTNPDVGLMLLRLAISFAVWHAFSLFQLLYVFPSSSIDFSKTYKYVFIPIIALVSIFTLSPFVFSSVSEVSSSGRIISVINGPGIALFTIMVLAQIVSALIVFIRKTIKAKKENRKSFIYMLLGIVLTFILILVFNFVFPAFLNDSRFIVLGAVFIFPFILFTTYSIVRHNLLNVKVISTEILTLVLALVILFEVITSTDIISLIFRSSIFILVVSVGILLVRSVVREVKQREELQVLTEELKLANDKLLVLDKARAEFISIASHQLRTPPATIKWYLAAILSGDYGTLDPGVKETLIKAEVVNNSQISLIDDLLNASRIERGKMEFLFEPTDISTLAKITVDQLVPQATIKKLSLVYYPPERPLPEIMADKEKLRQVINNMIDNAIKYSTEGQIKISAFEKDGNVLVSVTDSGKGIEPDQLSGVFEKYNRGKDSATHATGLGLGMYVAKVVIEQHKGKIWAESQGQGRGSTFIFSIPIHSGVEATTMVDLTKSN